MTGTSEIVRSGSSSAPFRIETTPTGTSKNDVDGNISTERKSEASSHEDVSFRQCRDDSVPDGLSSTKRSGDFAVESTTLKNSTESDTGDHVPGQKRAAEFFEPMTDESQFQVKFRRSLVCSRFSIERFWSPQKIYS